MEALTHDLNAFISGADAILNALQQLAEDTQALVQGGHGPDMKQLCEMQMATVKRMKDEKAATIDKVFKEQFILPLNNYMGQYREINNRVVERNRRGEEADKLTTTKEKQTAKGDPRMGGTEIRLETAKQAYEELNIELIRDMPLLIADSDKFFHPVIALMIVNQNKFWTAMAGQISWLATNANLSMAAIPKLVEVITSKMDSAMTRRYQSSANPWAAPPGGDPYASGSGGAQAPPQGYPGPGYGAPAPYGPPQPAYGGAQPSYGAQPAYPPAAQNAPVPSLPPRPGGAPPALPNKTPQAQALWDFNGVPGELSFRAGEMINIQTSQGDWWTGELRGQTGAFPGNYVKML